MLSSSGDFVKLLGKDDFFKTNNLDVVDKSVLPIIWFRGHSNSVYKLQPNLYRKVSELEKNQ